MISPYERSDLIHIMKMNGLTMADSGSARLEFAGQINGNNYRVKILAVESLLQLVVRFNGEVVCSEMLRSIDDLKIFLEEHLYKFLEV